MPLEPSFAPRRRARRAPHAQTSWGLAVAVASVIFCVSYAAQRLFSFAMGEPAPGTVIQIGHTPYYWRLIIAVLHAAISLAFAKLAIDDHRAEDILRFAPMWVPCVVLPLALLLVGLP